MCVFSHTPDCFLPSGSEGENMGTEEGRRCVCLCVCVCVGISAREAGRWWLGAVSQP